MPRVVMDKDTLHGRPNESRGLILERLMPSRPLMPRELIHARSDQQVSEYPIREGVLTKVLPGRKFVTPHKSLVQASSTRPARVDVKNWTLLVIEGVVAKVANVCSGVRPKTKKTVIVGSQAYQ